MITFVQEVAVSRKGIVCSVVILSFLILASVGCGSGNRQLQSITVTPNSATPPNSGAAVQFIAVGTYSGGSPAQGPVSSLQWCASPGPGVCVGQNVKPGVTINQAGLAQCNTGASGTWTINANSPPTDAQQPGGEIGANIVFGSATLTCP
jgi:hypothetical protein